VFPLVINASLLRYLLVFSTTSFWSMSFFIYVMKHENTKTITLLVTERTKKGITQI
jgi:hypothetical protein